MTSELGTAPVTGASKGIGAAYAERLADRGHDLILVARNSTELDALAQRISIRTGRSVEVLAADLTRPDDLRRVEEVLRVDAAPTGRAPDWRRVLATRADPSVRRRPQQVVLPRRCRRAPD